MTEREREIKTKKREKQSGGEGWVREKLQG